MMMFIVNYTKKYGYAPSYDEIGKAVGLKSRSSVCLQIQNLLDEGKLETDHPGSPRALRVPRKEEANNEIKTRCI